MDDLDAIIERKTALGNDDEQLRQQASQQVPSVYHDYLDIFSKADSDIIPPFRTTVDHYIELLPDK